MEERRVLMLMACYLAVTAITFHRFAAFFEGLGLVPGWWSAGVLLYAAPAAYWWALRDQRATFRLQAQRPVTALLTLALIVLTAMAIYSNFAIAVDERVVLAPSTFSFSGKAPWILCAGVGLVFLWRKPRPKATRIHFRGKRLQTSEEVDSRVRVSLKEERETPLIWGGERLPRKAGHLHFVVIGVTGSGKTLTLRLLMQSVLGQIGKGKDTRALIYDAKGDLYSLLAGMGATNIHTLNPFDKRCVALDFAADFTSPAAALQLATLLVPENPKASQPFFDNAARSILTKVILAFIQNAPGRWDLRDVILATAERERLVDVLGSTVQTAAALQYFEREESARDVMSTLASRLAPFELIAAAWSKAERKLSLRDWLKEESVLILGNDESLRAAMQAVNGLIFQRLSELCLQQTESETRETWFFLDEVREAGKLAGLGRLLTNGRSKGVCVCLGFQDIDGMREAYGERLANEIVGQCNSRAVLRLESVSTAEWAAKHLGIAEVLEESTSESENQNGLRRALSSSKSLAIKQDYNVLPSELLDIALTDRTNGLTGYYQTPFTGAFRRTLTSAWLTEHLKAADNDVIDTMPRDEADQYLQPWQDADSARLMNRQQQQSVPSHNVVEPDDFGILADL